MISFQFKTKRKTQLFLKYPQGAPPPAGPWECHCGSVNQFTGGDEVYCPKCGTKLKITQNLDDRQKLYTVVRVAHIEGNGNGGSSGQTSP